MAGLRNFCQELGLAAEIERPPKGVLAILSANEMHLESRQQRLLTMRSGIPANIASALLPFQREGVLYDLNEHSTILIHRLDITEFQYLFRFALQRNGRVLIADDMGLGKTLQAIAVATYYSGQWPLLIVCPSSLRSNWMEVIVKMELFLIVLK